MRDFAAMNFDPGGLYGLLHLSAASTFAVAHPVYDLLSREAHAPFLVVHQVRLLDLAVLAVTLSLLLPVSLWLLVKTSKRLSNAVSTALFSVVLAMLIAAALMPAISQAIPRPAVASLAICGGIALGAVAAYWRFSAVRSFFSFLSLAVVASLLLFFLSEPVQMAASSAQQPQVAAPSDSENRPDIVMIVFDELPLVSLLTSDRQIDPVLYPNFAALQATATWYRNTLSAHYATTGAIASLLVGGHFSKYSARWNRNRSALAAGLTREKAPHNLFSLLEENYRIHAMESTSKLAPESQRVKAGSPGFAVRMTSLAEDTSVLYLYSILPEALHAQLPPIGAQWKDFGEPPPTAETGRTIFIGAATPAGQFIQLLEEDFVPTVYYLHLLLPHYPFVFSETGLVDRNRFPFVDETVRRATGINNWPNAAVAELVQQAHLFQVSYADLLLGVILERLKTQGLFDETLIIVTADHGTSFYWNEGELTGQQMTAVQASETLQVPLIIKWPGQVRAQVVDIPAQTIDIVPTISATLGLGKDWTFEGVSLLEPVPEDRARSAFIPDFRAFLPHPKGQQYALRRKTELFGSESRERLYYLGPGRDLIGRLIEDVVARESPAKVVLSRHEAFADVQPSTRHVPAYVEGEIRGLAGPSSGQALGVAVAVNGRIVNTAHPLPGPLSELRKTGRPPTPHEPGGGQGSAEGLHFIARIPASSLHTGSNEVEILLFLVEGTDGYGQIYRLSRAVNSEAAP